MMNILRQKIDRLVQDDDGAALVITLALFMMMYISCAGVFAIGQTVKDKMILQNAADAASYSAAIVQADTLSRIAVLNREMAWVYKDMVGRQMDYIVCRWLEDACNEYESDASTSDWMSDTEKTPNCITLRGQAGVLEADAKTESGKATALAEAIERDSRIINELAEAIRDLMDNYDTRVQDVVEDVLMANLPDSYSRDVVWQCKRESPYSWSKVIGGGKDNEIAFLAFADLDLEDCGNSHRDWFPVDNAALTHVCADGSFFDSDWIWWKPHNVPHYRNRAYNHVDKLRDDSHVNVDPAQPRVIEKSFYDDEGVRKGAITVGVAKYNRNPWARLVETGSDGVRRGLYEVFQPCRGAIDWTWAISSAQAGYRDRHESESEMDYRADWDEDDQDWNLRTDNFDAVYVPVCQSFVADDFKDWIAKDWQTLSTSPASDLPAYDPATMTAALPNMHNSGQPTASLKWDKMLENMYH